MTGIDDVELPRRNGELAFDAPWQSRAFGLGVAVVETCFGRDWEPFRRRLIASIAADEHRPYWDSWTIALEELLLAAGIVTADDLVAVGAADT